MTYSACPPAVRCPDRSLCPPACQEAGSREDPLHRPKRHRAEPTNPDPQPTTEDAS